MRPPPTEKMLYGNVNKARTLFEGRILVLLVEEVPK
jgi:hypothetical protein